LSLQRLKKSETTDFQMLKQGTICPGKFIQMSCCWEHFIGRLENESKSVLYKGKSIQEIDISLQLDHESGCSHTAVRSAVWSESYTLCG